MNVIFSDQEQKEIASFERQLQGFFQNHVDKLSRMPPRRHLKFGVPWSVEDVTRQARLVYDEEDNTLRVVRCFATHKEYERWYNSFR